MIGMLSGLHPTFDALSAHADRSELDGASTRVGRHVARCATCRDVVAEIRALGAAARAMRADGAPPNLWARIESTMANRGSTEPAPRRETPAPEADAHRTAADLPPTRTLPAPHRGRRALVGLGIAAMAVAIIAVVAWPRTSGLQAAGTSRLTFVPGRPVPGGTLGVRYQPASWMKDAPRLILVGRFARGAGTNPQRFGGRVFEQLGDSLGELTRAADGAFVATVTLPPDFLAVGLGVLDPVRDEQDMDGSSPWIVIGGTPARAPSFAALLAAREIAPGWFGGDGRYRPRQAVDVADSLKRYFPRHPAGWAFSRSYGVSKGRFDFLRYFQSAERKYSSLFEELSTTEGLDAERLHDMVEFARNIGEPAEELRWAARLAAEHPEDPRALSDLAGALHEIELREPPALGDSIRSWMPALDHAYRAGPVPNHGFGDALRLVASYGDSSTKEAWLPRSLANGVEGNIWMMVSRMRTRPADGAARDAAVRELRARVGQPCTLPPGRLPLTEMIGTWRKRCEIYRGMAYGALSSQTLRDGNPRRGLGEADSALTAMRRGEFCAPSLGYINRAIALLALGDTASAETDFVLGSAAYLPGTAGMADTARAHLGSRFEQARFVARVDTAHRAAKACQSEQSARARVRDDRRGP